MVCIPKRPLARERYRALRLLAGIHLPERVRVRAAPPRIPGLTGEVFPIAPAKSDKRSSPRRSDRRFRNVPAGLTSTLNRRVLALAFSLLALAAGCGSSHNNKAATSTTRRATPTTASSTTVVSGAAMAQQVADAYRAADKANLDAAAIPDPIFPALLATHTGPMLDQRQKVLKAFKLQGLIGRLPPNSKYRNDIDVASIRINGDVAIFNVCAVDDSERVEKATGRVVGGGLNTVLIQVAMRRDGDAWKLAERKELQRWTGESGCAAP